jgi:hypothetical protein
MLQICKIAVVPLVGRFFCPQIMFLVLGLVLLVLTLGLHYELLDVRLLRNLRNIDMDDRRLCGSLIFVTYDLLVGLSSNLVTFVLVLQGRSLFVYPAIRLRTTAVF